MVIITHRIKYTEIHKKYTQYTHLCAWPVTWRAAVRAPLLVAVLAMSARRTAWGGRKLRSYEHAMLGLATHRLKGRIRTIALWLAKQLCGQVYAWMCCAVSIDSRRWFGAWCQRPRAEFCQRYAPGGMRQSIVGERRKNTAESKAKITLDNHCVIDPFKATGITKYSKGDK